jgi:hypothetical protein
MSQNPYQLATYQSENLVPSNQYKWIICECACWACAAGSIALLNPRTVSHFATGYVTVGLSCLGLALSIFLFWTGPKSRRVRTMFPAVVFALKFLWFGN